jgi:hypothetical protein
MATDSLGNIEGANEELKEAQQYQKGSTGWFTAIFTALTIVLWMWEYLNSVYV